MAQECTPLCVFFLKLPGDRPPHLSPAFPGQGSGVGLPSPEAERALIAAGNPNHKAQSALSLDLMWPMSC